MYRVIQKLAPIAMVFASVTAVSSATETANLGVNAVVANTCTITAAPGLNFATIDSSSTSNETTAGVVTVLCTGTNSVTVTLGGGNNENSSQRRMIANPGEFLPYNLFSDSGHTSSIAVDGSLYTGTATALTPVVRSVYGQVPAGSYTAGTYSDTILVTLTY